MNANVVFVETACVEFGEGECECGSADGDDGDSGTIVMNIDFGWWTMLYSSCGDA